jgi:hypothetical protein
MASQFILTVDVGTSGTKTSLWTEAGQLVAHAAYMICNAEPLRAEIEAMSGGGLSANDPNGSRDEWRDPADRGSA